MVALATVRNLTIVATETGVDETRAKLQQLAAAQGGVAVASDRQEKATISVDRALDKLRRSTDAAYRDQQRFEAGQRVLNQAFDTGRIDAAEYGRQLDLLAAKYRQADAAQDRLGTGMGRLGGAMGTIKNFAGGFGLGAALSYLDPGNLVRGVRETVREVDNLGDAAERAGVSAERLQVLRYVLEQGAGAAEDADRGLERFNKSIGELAVTGKGPAADAMRQLGIEVRDATGAMRSQNDLLDEVIERFPRIRDESTAAAISARLFGREAGAGLAVALQQGAAGFQAAEDRLRSFNGVLSNESVQAMDPFERRFIDLTIKFEKAWQRIVAKALWGLTELGRFEHQMINAARGEGGIDPGAAGRRGAEMLGQSRVDRAFSALPSAVDPALTRQLQLRAFERTGDIIAGPSEEQENQAKAQLRDLLNEQKRGLAERQRLADAATRAEKAASDAFAREDTQARMASFREEIGRTADRLDTARDAARGFADTFISGIRNGEGVVGALSLALDNLSGRLTDLMMNSAFDALFGKQGSASLGLFGRLGGGLSSAALAAATSGGSGLFAAGGYTGHGGVGQAVGIVHGQEYVLSAAATRRIGRERLDAINFGLGRNYASGGFVQPAPQINFTNQVFNNASGVVEAQTETTRNANGGVSTKVFIEQIAAGIGSNPRAMRSVGGRTRSILRS